MASLLEQALPLVDYISTAVGKTHDFGHLTSQIYDTAWVSMIRLHNKQSNDLLFPECYTYILSRQLPSGGWESYDTDIDGIMNTFAALLALKKNWDSKYSPADIKVRIDRAVSYLRDMLNAWDEASIAECDHVGFEIIIPHMMELLEQEGVLFDFPGKDILMTLNSKKLAKIHPKIWSGKIQTTITHSLEAFGGKADFRGLSEQTVHGGMGSSPASTAAWLMYTEGWDVESEECLRNLIRQREPEVGSEGKGVPGMYATTGFEVLWISSTLLEYGFPAADLPGIKSLINITDEFYETLGGLASGFSRYSVPDADDTSKSVMVRNFLGVPTTPDRLIKRFEGKDHFLTYDMERHPSVTTNCNVLSAILESPEPARYLAQIEKVAKYLCNSWMRADVSFMDKWSISEFYPLMLLSESLIRLVKCWDNGTIPVLSHELIAEKIPLVLFQALLQTLQKQNSDGSWGHKPSRELTAYAIIALANLSSLAPLLSGDIAEQIPLAVERGRKFINETSIDIEYVWIAKVCYSPINISKAYVLAGLKTPFPKYNLSSKLRDLLEIPQQGVKQYTKFYSSLSTIKKYPKWRVQGSVIEGYLFLKQLKKVRIDMFGRKEMKKDEYFDFIAMTFAAGNNLFEKEERKAAFLRGDVLFNMMELVLRVYQVDEFVEGVVGRKFGKETEKVKRIVDELFKTPTEIGKKAEPNGTPNGHPNGKSNGKVNGKSNGHSMMEAEEDSLTDVQAKLKAFVRSILQHPSVLASTPYDQGILSQTLHECLLAHISQITDSQSWLTSHKTPPQGSYHKWARTTAAAHSCAPLSLAYLRCLTNNPSNNRPKSALEQYLAQDLWVHLSNKARMENDRASLRRDRKESNLNSLDFPEFPQARDEEDSESIPRSKEQLSLMISYEKRCIDMGIEALKKAAGKSRNGDLDTLRFYHFLTDIYSDVYTIRDISCEQA